MSTIDCVREKIFGISIDTWSLSVSDGKRFFSYLCKYVFTEYVGRTYIILLYHKKILDFS